MRLQKLSLHNFKGLNFTLDTQGGGNVDILAWNGTGKTRVYDSFLWLLFGIDSKNRSDHKIKNEDENGDVIHFLDHSVKAVIDLEDQGQPLILERVYKEKWTKTRGTNNKTLDGHETNYFIDVKGVSKREYDDRIAELCNRELLKILTNPRYFAQELKVDERRKVLLEYCGDITDAEVIHSNGKLKELPTILKGRSLEDHRSIAKAQMTKTNQALRELPARVDEATRALPDITGLSAPSLANKRIELSEKRTDKLTELTRTQSGGEVAEKNKQLAEISTELINIKNAHKAKASAGVDVKRQELSAAKQRTLDLSSDNAEIERRMLANNNSIKSLESDVVLLRQQWNEENAKEFTFEQSDTCPACNQSLPAEKLKDARDKALEEFNRTKAERLEAINTEGKDRAKAVEEFKAIHVELEIELTEGKRRLTEAQAKVDALQAEINSMTTQETPIETMPDYQAKLTEKATIESAIEELKINSADQISKVEAEIEALNNEISEVEAGFAALKQHTEGQARIEELSAKEKELAREYERLESEMFLMDEFTKTKVKLLDDKINSQFELTRFKLFEIQVNGALKDLCDVTHLWNPPSNAEETLIGLDIIRTFSRLVGTTFPIFVDNAESINQLINMPGQIIRLVVSDDKQLRVETKSRQLQEVS